MTIQQSIQSSIETKQQILQNPNLIQQLKAAIDVCVNCFRRDGKVLFCGNGGSAADAQHLAAELSGRYYYDRPPLYAEALHVNTSYLTAVANDYDFGKVYSRMVEASGRKSDVLVGLSTSGNSTNVVEAFIKAKEIGMTTIAFTGAGGGKLRQYADILLDIPATDTARIQEAHILFGHILCEFIEKRVFPKK
ncbi:MAG: D-sedoheptulose 7-phosphate isomerase [Bacteroidetes bacterium]|jgi:D-sedoheptulose 7-phosphate isomerase|nr:D-sedoheptulose 7-phosphate isomerase [Bacteroidota bacterium]